MDGLFGQMKLWKDFFNFILKLKGCIRVVNRKLPEKKEPEKVGCGEKIKTFSQGCLWSWRSSSVLWIRELQDKACQPSYYWQENNWTTPGIFRAASTCHSEKLPHQKEGFSFSFFCSFPTSWLFHFGLLFSHNSPSGHRGHPHRHEVTGWDTI